MHSNLIKSKKNNTIHAQAKSCKIVIYLCYPMSTTEGSERTDMMNNLSFSRVEQGNNDHVKTTSVNFKNGNRQGLPENTATPQPQTVGATRVASILSRHSRTTLMTGSVYEGCDSGNMRSYGFGALLLLFFAYM